MGNTHLVQVGLVRLENTQFSFSGASRTVPRILEREPNRICKMYGTILRGAEWNNVPYPLLITHCNEGCDRQGSENRIVWNPTVRLIKPNGPSHRLLNR
jgi:hypothetical protein